jgi:hypothetical protein
MKDQGGERQYIPERDLRCIFDAVTDLLSAAGATSGFVAATAIFVVLEVDDPASDADEGIC